MSKYQVFIGAVLIGFALALFWTTPARSQVKPTEAEISRDGGDVRESSLSELFSSSADKVAPRMLPPREPEEVSAVQRRAAEESPQKSGENALTSLLTSVTSALRGSSSSDSADVGPTADTVVSGSKFSDGGDILNRPPIIAGQGKEKVNYAGPSMTREQCKAKYGQLKYFKPSEKRLPPMLYTFPGSGNTWGRLLIEYATGIYSGSVYNDRTLLQALPGEFTCDWSVSVIKVHPHTHNAAALLHGGFNSDNMKCKRGRVQKFEKAVLLIRDPFDSIWSEFQRRLTQSHVAGIPSSYFDWFRWQANAANMAYKYWEMWQMQYTAIERELPRENVLYIKYEDLKDKDTRVNAMHDVARFLGVDSSPEQLECSFILAENPGAHRKLDKDSMTKKVAYTKPVACRMWNLFGTYATRVGYKAWDDAMDCTTFPKMQMVNVGPQGEYNHKWVKPGATLLDFGDHPPNGPQAGISLIRGPGYGLPSGGGTLAGGGSGGPGLGAGRARARGGRGGGTFFNKQKKGGPGAGGGGRRGGGLPGGMDPNVLVPRGGGGGGGGGPGGGGE